MVKEINMNKRSRCFWIVLFMIGIAGSVLFFPVRLPGGHTCVGHHFLKNSCPVSPTAMDRDAMLPENPETMVSLTGVYVFPFGVLWWISLVILFWAFSGWRKYQ